MPRTTKATNTATEKVETVELAPGAETKTKKPRATKTVAPVVEVVTTPTEETVVTESVDTPITELCTDLISKIQLLSVALTSIKNDFRTLEKKYNRELKAAQKQSSKRKRKAGNRAPSGFVKPTKISDELAVFLEKPSGTEMARTEVTRDINKYIRTNSLQDKTNGRKINPDQKLALLLKLSKTDELTYFNLQKYMSPHFYKAVKAEATTAV